MSLRDRIISILSESLTPIYLDVTNFSEQHRHHDGYGNGGESHFNVVIVSDAFDGKSRLERQRMVYALLHTELRTHIHALTLKTLTSAEAKARQTFQS